jgi:deoxyribodipyrimidine photo-lyase
MDELKSRIYPLKVVKSRGKCVLYMMSRDQRVSYNHALLVAQKHAIASGLPLCVVFCLYGKTGHRSREQYEFMLEGLKGVESNLGLLNVPFMLLIGDPKEKLSAVFHHTTPEAVYFDFNPLRGPRHLHNYLAERHEISMYEVDTHNIVPARALSSKMEVGAYTIRPKLHKLLSAYLVEPEKIICHPHAWPGKIVSLSELSSQIDDAVKGLTTSGVKIGFKSGEEAAASRLESFIRDGLSSYVGGRNDPSRAAQSGLSPYLHFGQLSSLEVALKLREVSTLNSCDLHLLHSPTMPKAEATSLQIQAGIDALLEEMIVRKELSDNYCLHNTHYDRLEAAPAWARASLDKHRSDPREHIYTKEQLEGAQTHDPAWNAAQKQLTTTGRMHGYMRMYWAKKVLEWTEKPERAIEILIYLNDFYSIDGGDPNGYAGILWSVGGVHDRPWAERDIFGVIRYMNYAGLKRKFDIRSYEERWR